MKILSLDTSTKHFSLAILDGDKVLASKELVMDKILSQSIIPTIDAALKKAKCKIPDIDAFVVGLGPGSFTSLRVGLATIKGLSFVVKKPVVGIPSLDAIGLGIKEETAQVCVIQDARRNLVYTAIYQKQKGMLKRIGKYQLISLDDLLKENPFKGEILFTGDAIALYRERIVSWGKAQKFQVSFDDHQNPSAKDLAALAGNQLKSKKFMDVAEIVPLYLYPADCQVRP